MGRQIPDIAGNATHPRAPLAVGQVGRRIDRHAARRQGTPKGRVGIRHVDMQGARNRCPRAPCLAHFAQRVAEADLSVHRGAIVVRIAPDHRGIEGRDHERDHPLRVAHRQVRGDGAKAGSRIRFGVGHRAHPSAISRTGRISLPRPAPGYREPVERVLKNAPTAPPLARRARPSRARAVATMVHTPGASAPNRAGDCAEVRAARAAALLPDRPVPGLSATIGRVMLLRTARDSWRRGAKMRR